MDVSAIDKSIKKDGSLSTLEINFGGNYQWQLNVALYNILGENYTMVESTPGLPHDVNPLKLKVLFVNTFTNRYKSL